MREATYRCVDCRRLSHVRCMLSDAGVGGRPSTIRTTCYMCAAKLAAETDPTRLPNDPRIAGESDAPAPRVRAGSTITPEQLGVIDVMGVCT